MRYVPSDKVIKDNVNYEGLETRIPWVLGDGTLQYLDNKYKIKELDSVLDIGCGNGMVFEYFDVQTKLYGTDLNDYMTTKVSSRVEFYQHDINYNKLPFENETLDLVLAFQVVEHLENPLLIAREAARVLKPGGMFIFSLPNAFTLTSKLRFLLTDNLTRWRKDNDHLFFLLPDVFDKTYGRHFDLVEVRYQKGMLPLATRLLGALGLSFEKDKLKILPRNKWFAKSGCYVLRKKQPLDS